MAAVPPRYVGLVAECVHRALYDIGWNKKEAAALMGISVWELSRQCQSRGVNFVRLLMLGPIFMARFEYHLHRQLTEEWSGGVVHVEHQNDTVRVRVVHLEGAR